ncbi:MAG: hypothetical protein OEN55_00315 [Alphaproteobacteria bacterium]|nr:hypothetical protein [Alphaproteobacteria bacterium]
MHHRNGSRPVARRHCFVPLLILAVVLAWPLSVQSQVYEVGGLRLGMTLLEAQLVYPDLTVRQVPYEDETVGTDYEVFHGGLAPLRYEGRLLVERAKGGGFELVVIFTGRPELYAIQAKILDPGVKCNGAVDRLVGDYGPAMIDDRPYYASWRQVVVIGPELVIRCLDDSTGLYIVTLQQPYLQELYLQDLLRELRPAIEAALQYLG